MNAQAILIKIEEDSRDVAASILRDAHVKAEQIQKASEQKVESGRLAALEQAKRDALAMDDRMRRMAVLDARKALLAAKRQVLDEAFASAQAKMQNMKPEQASAFGLSLLLASAQGNETVLPDSKAVWCDQSFIDKANQALTKSGKMGALNLSDEKSPIGGGFLLKRGGMEMNCSFQAVLDAQRMDMEAEVAALLFE